MGCCQITQMENIEVNISTLSASDRYTPNNRDIIQSEDELKDLSLVSIDIKADDLKTSQCDNFLKFTTVSSCESTQKFQGSPSVLKNKFDLECALRVNMLKRKNDVLFKCRKGVNRPSFSHDLMRRNSKDLEPSTNDHSFSLSLNFKPSLSIFLTPRNSFWMLASRSPSNSSCDFTEEKEVYKV